MRFKVELNPDDLSDALVIAWITTKAEKYDGNVERAVYGLALWPAVCRDMPEEALEVCRQIEADELAGKYNEPDVPDTLPGDVG